MNFLNKPKINRIYSDITAHRSTTLFEPFIWFVYSNVMYLNLKITRLL